MRDIQYFSKLRGFLSNRRRRRSPRTGARHSSPFALESLEARVLLSADLAAVVKQAPIVNTAVAPQQAIIQNVQTIQAAPATTAMTQALTLNGSAAPSAIAPGATMTVNVMNPTGNAKDWIGIYQVGQSSSTKSVVEHYVARTDYAIPSSTPAGTYEARLFANDSRTLLATSAPITVGPVTAPAPTPTPTPPPTSTPPPTTTPAPTMTPALTVNGSAASSAIAPGATTTINVVNPTGNTMDWIGIYQVGQSSSTKSVVEHYVARTDYAIPSSTPAGTYEARLFANDSRTLLATSAPITVGPVTAPSPTPTPTPPPTSTPPPTITSVSASWYVSTTGSDSSDGRTVDTSFRTIGNAVAVAQPGDVVLVRGGVYGEYIKIANSGTSNSPITLASYPGETAILDGSSRTPNPNNPITNWSGRQAPLLTVAGSHVIVKDLEIRNSADIGVEVDGNNVLLDHLNVHNTYYAGVTFWATHDCTIQNSTVHDAFDNNNLGDSGENADGINAGGFSTRLTIRNNECYHNSDDGIDVGNSTYVLVEGNNLHHNGYGQGGDGEGGKVLNGTNNTFQNNVAHDQRIGFDSGESGGNFFYNNTAYNNYQTDYIEYYGNTSVNTGNSWN